MLVVADATPLRYLTLIEHLTILPTLYGRIVVPQAVLDELQHPHAPAPVHTFLTALPAWLEVRQVQLTLVGDLLRLGAGESEALLRDLLTRDAARKAQPPGQGSN